MEARILTALEFKLGYMTPIPFIEENCPDKWIDRKNEVYGHNCGGDVIASSSTSIF
jgi:hypothetical protein